MKLTKTQRGFTLVELLAVIIIIGILAAIAVPAISKITENNRHKATKSEAIIMLEAAQLYFPKLYFIENPEDYGKEWQTIILPDLIEMGYMESQGYLNQSAYVTNVTPVKICANSEGKSKITFYNATAEQIVNSKQDIKVGNEKCGDLIP